jgi:hypothetical protein
MARDQLLWISITATAVLDLRMKMLKLSFRQQMTPILLPLSALTILVLPVTIT